MTSTPPPASDLRIIIREKASVGAVPCELVTKVWTEDAQTPPARVTSVANKARPPVANPAPIQVCSDVFPGEYEGET